MSLVSLDKAKEYLRVDSDDDNDIITSILSTSCSLCADVARLTDEQWDEVDNEDSEYNTYEEKELTHIRKLMKIAILYSTGYLYEHREEADHHDLTLTLRSLLFSIREGVY